MQLFALFCVTFVTLSITSFVESNISSHRETDTLHIIPSHVKSDVWINKNAALVQDVNENGVYQSFSGSNSAYLKDIADTEIVHESEPDSSNSATTDIPTEVDNNDDFETTPASEVETNSMILEDSEGVQEPEISESNDTELVSTPLAEENSVSEATELIADVAVPQHDEGNLPETSNLEQEDVQSTLVDDEVPVREESRSRDSDIIFSNFDFPSLNSGQLVKNIQLRISLAAELKSVDEESMPYIDVEYFLNGAWINAGAIIIDGDTSNAFNGGYFLFALPEFTELHNLTDFEVRLSYVGNIKKLSNVFVDSIWLDIDTETFDRSILEERLSPEELSYAKLPALHELISTDLDFSRTEKAQFVLRYESQRNAVVRFFRNLFSDNLAIIESVTVIRRDGGVADVHPEVNATPDGLWSIQLSDEDEEKLQPGTYSIRLEVKEGGKTFVDTFDFQWGMLAINPSQTEYTTGDVAQISLAALSSNGNTICDADLNLYIINPLDYISEVPVQRSGLCSGNNVVDTPDYSASFTLDTVGTYEMYVEHVSQDGEVLSHTRDTFEVVDDSHDIWIERNGPTRIYPSALYPMQISVHTEEAFKGILTERVPTNFIISDTDAHITYVDNMQELSWNIDVAASSSATFSYAFDAPDISPYLYNVGPAEITSDDANIVVIETLPTTHEELLTETIITDTEGVQMMLDETEVSTEDISTEAVNTQTETPQDSGVLLEQVEDVLPVEEPTEEPSIIETIVDAVFGNEDETSETVSAVEESGEVISAPLQESVEEPGIIEKIIDAIFGEDEVVPTEVAPSIEEVLATTTPTNPNAFVEGRKWQIASDATGSMLLYWASTTIPSGWTCVSCQASDVFYQRFVLGSSTAGTNGGAATHTHTATGAVTASAASASINSGGGANVPTVGHAHTYTPTISTNNNLPAYTELALIQHNSAGSPATIPAGAIAIFDAAVPTGWTRYSLLDGRYIRAAASTTAGTASSSNTHIHSISGSTLGSTGALTANAGDNLVNTATNGHTHVVSSATAATNHEPPYREAILGRLTATSSPTDLMIGMWTDTPPTGWSTVSSTSEPFVNRFVKASTTYGGTGGSATTTHANVTGIVSGAPVGTQTRDLVTIDNTVTTNAHTHLVNVTSFTTVTTLPPYRTAIFAKRGVGGAAPSAPTVHVLFDNEKTGTSTPRFEFTTDDPDGADTLVYQFQWDDDIDLESSPTGDRTSNNESGCTPNCFSNTASTTDTNPFTDNERIRFTIQTPLVSGTTYYYRVRAQETIGATWGSWSTIQSVTYESSVNPSQWFQSEGTQFEDGTRTNVSTTTGAVTLSTTTTSVPTVVSGWTGASTSPGTTLTLRKPSNVEVGDLLIIIVGNDDNTDTDQWDNATLKPTGFTLINEAGNTATSDAHSAAFYRIADGTENATTSVPAQVSADYWGYYLRVTGASTTNPINVTGADFNGAGSPHAVTGITTTASNTLAFYILSGDGADTYPFSVSGTGWSESAETFAGLTGTESAGTWGTRSMVNPGATGAATVAMTVSDSASGFQFAINPSTARGTIMSPEIDFDSVSGQVDWGAVGFSATEPTGTDVKLRVYYTSTTSCDSIVPDTVLSGNSSGFDVSQMEVVTQTFSTSTYNRICLKGTLLQGTGTTSPTLDDWSVYWDVPQQSPVTPRLADTPAFDFMKSTTTQPVFGGFSSGDYENDRMEYEITIDDTADFSSPVLTKQSSNYPTDTGWASSTFASNATTTYIVQPADALLNGTTYYWKVRVRDPLGSNTWSEYSTSRSMTLSNAVTVAEWFQTTDDQFAMNPTLSNASSSGTDTLEIIDQDISISLLDAWSLGTTKTISSGTDRLLVIAIYDEDAATDNINTVTYGGSLLTEIYDQTVGLGTSGSLWVGYLDEARIASSSGSTIVPTWTPGSPPAGDVIYSSAVFQYVNQTTPVRGYTSNALTTGASIAPTASSTVYTGDVAFYAVGAGDGRTYTPHSGYTEGTDSAVCGGGCSSATAYKLIVSDGTELPTATLSSSANRVAMTMVVLQPSPAEAVIVTPTIDFDWVSNQSDWGEISWNLDETSGNDSRLQVYYASSSSSTCTTLIPNSALSGNSTGYAAAASPLNIASLATSTYNKICLGMNLNAGTSTTSPMLEDWTVSWEPQAVFTQTTYQWYVNTASATPSDIWPAGATALSENEAINATDPTKTDDVLRLRIGLNVSSVAASSKSFKLQYSEGNTCLAWNDVGGIGSTTALWRGYDNAGLTDGQTLASSTLLGADTLETYEEENNSSVMPNSISVSARGEWDFVLQNRGSAGTEYCFRMVKSDGTPLTSYSAFPQLITNESPSIVSVETPFDNEKVASTSPWFEITGVDPEADSIDYQVQIDNDLDFSSTVIDTESEFNLDDFLNVVDGSDKSPFDDSATIRYIIPSALTNGVTYWWRARPVDTEGSTIYGDWMTAQSFTIDTNATTTTTWFQTTEEQFDTDTLVGTDATGSDLVTFASGSTTGTTTSSAIDFDDVTLGNAWGELSWTDTEPPGDIAYHVEYYNGSTWDLIPNTALAGNITGFDTSPVNLIDLDTEVYNQIRIRANFTNPGGTPILSDWTVTWGLRVSVPTHLLLFDNEKTGTTTPTFTFYSTDPDSDDLEYEISWSTDNTFASGTTTRNSSTSVGFTNTEAVDTTPFISGDVISYTIATSSALTNGTTYWWRLRARDTNGSNAYSFWSDPWSFTVDTTATTSTWFQTTQEQFDTDTLLSLIASTSDSVSTIPAGVTTYTFAGVTNPSTGHVARYFEVDVNDPTDPPTVNEIDSLTNNGTSAGTPNLNSGIAGYAGNVEASTVQYTSLSVSDNNSWTTTDPGAGDNAIFWSRFNIAEDPADIDQIDIQIEARQSGVPGLDKGWFGIWRPGSTTPYWQVASSSTQTADATYSLSITTNIDEYFDGSNRIHLIYFNEDDDDPVIVDYVKITVTSNTADSGTLTGASLDFDDGVAPAWGQFKWVDSEPGASSITYRLQYLTTGGSWALIPDGVLAGNSTGFTTSPVILGGIDTTTYNEIRPIADFDCVLSSCPTLSDWTITWSPGFSVAGTAFEYDGIASTTSGTVAVAVNGVLQTGKTGTISNGSWSIANVSFFEGDVITVFVSGANDADEAVGVTVYDGSPDISGLRLQKRRLTIGSDDYATVSNVNLGEYDYTDDEDLFFDINGGDDLTMCADVSCGDAGIVIKSLNTYAPGTGADISTHDFKNDGTFTSGANTLRVSGSWDDNATSTLTGSSVIFTATSSIEFIDERNATTTGFNNLTLGETSGTATWNASSSIDVNGNMSVARGTFARASTSVTIAGNLTTEANGFWSGMGTTTFDGINPSTWTDSNGTKQNIGRVEVEGTSKSLLLGSSVVLQSLLVGANDIFDAVSNYTVSVYSDWINTNTFIPRTSTVNFIATTTNRTITAGGDAFYNLTFGGAGGSWAFSEADLSITNDFAIATGTVTMPTGTTTISGSFSSVGGTFAHNNATMYFTSSAAETVAASGTPFTNNFYNLRFTGSGSWSFLDTSATTSNNLFITQGTVTFPNNTLSIGGSLTQSGGSFAHNSGTVKFTNAATQTIDINSSSFNSLSFTGAGSRSFVDASVTVLGNVSVTGGTLVLPSGTLTLGGSFTNTATTTHNSGTVLFNSIDVGETISLGNSSLYNMTFNSLTGGWTIAAHATTTNNFTLSTTSTFTLASGQTLAVGGVFTNDTKNASTTWTGSTLSLEAGNYSINSKSNNGDTYGTLRVKANTDISMWNSTSTVYAIDTTGSLYSQDHNGVDGDLYIFGEYVRASGTEYWSYDTDFDGAALGGSSRQVDVRFASGTTALIGTSTLSIVGSATGSTTIANQGSGTYTITVLHGTTTAAYYDFANLGLTGLRLASSTKVTAFSDGRFIAGTASGTSLTISSSTIDANPGLQIYRVDFSTTTAITARNVTQNDGTPSSYWWFRNSVGNIDGEAFDTDTGDPGSIRWDDSSLSIVVSGTVYSDDGVTTASSPTCDGSTPNVKVVINSGTTATSTWCSAVDGSYNITVSGIIGDVVLTTYLDTNGGERGTVITKTPTANISNHNIYVNRIITKHQDILPLTISDMTAYDFGSDNDIRYDAATGTINTLTVFSGNELHIASSTTFAPGGDIMIYGNASSTSFDGSLHIDDNATFTGSATSTYTLAGSFTMDTGATFTAASTTVIMNATTTGKTITTIAGQEISFNNLQFTGVGGGWNINGNTRALGNIAVSTGTVSGTANITVVNGSLSGNGLLSMGSGTTTVGNTNTLGGTTAWTFANLVLGNGTVVGTTTPGSNATTTVSGKLTISTAHFLDAGSSLWNLSGTGNVFVENGTFLEDTSTLRYSGTGATNILSTTYYNLDLKAFGGSPTYTATGLGVVVTNDMTVGGATTTTVTFDTSDPALDVNGNVTIDSTGTFVGSASAAFTVAGNWDNNGIYTGSGGTVTFDGSVTSSISAGSSSFANVIINGSGAFTVSEHATATSAFTLTNAGSFTVQSGQALAVGGVFTNSQGGGVTTWTGSTLSLFGTSNYQINASTTADVYNVLKVGSGTQIRMWNSSASTYDISASGSLYSQDHSGINGDLYIYGAYTKTSGTDFWNYGTDFDGTDITGSERTADVYIASGSSVLYTGGGLSVVGASGASTTIQNQGSGTYSFRIAGVASTTWSQYQMRNADSSGLTFSGTPNVVSLSFGDIAVAQNSGTAMTVGGTVITQNPAKTFTGNNFGTSTGVSPAFNVTATGTAASSWRFTNHTGAIDGEAFDVDPNGDPGYIVWDDSSANITVSGTVYSGEGAGVSTACDGATSNIHLRVAGLTSYTGVCSSGDGTYSIPGVLYSPGDSLVVYIDNEPEKAATVSEDPVSNISGFDLYENRIIVRHESADPLSIADMAIWDSSDDADIPFTAVDGSPDTLTLPSDRKLIVWTGKEFEPNGNVTISGGGGGAAYDGTLELFANAVFDATGSEVHSIGGSLVMGSGAVLDDETSTFTFTTSGSARTIDTNEYSFYNLILSGSGSWSVTNTALDVGNDFTITQGAVTLPVGTTTVTGSFAVTGGSFIASGGTMLFNSGSGETIRAGGSNFYRLTINGTGNFTLLGGNATVTNNMRILDGTFTSATGTVTIGGSFINNDVFTHNSGTLRFIATTTTPITAGGSDLSSTTFVGSGPYTFTDTNVALMGSLKIEGGSVTLATGTMSIAGSFLNTGGTFNNASGTILFNSSDTGESVNPGVSPFNIVSFASASGGWTLTNNATSSSNFSITSASSFTVSSSTRLFVGGVFTNLVGGVATTWTGTTLVVNSGSSYTINTKAAGGDVYNNVLIGSSTNLRAWDSAGNVTITDGQSSFYSQDHAGVSGSLYIYGNYARTTGSDYWSYATDFDGVLLGGSSRQVFVYYAPNATTTIQGGTLNIVGANGFDTTISNQGSGTYTMDILSGALNAQYFSFSNMDSDGLNLSGATTTITALTEGNFTLAVDGGSLITLASSTLNYNAGLVSVNSSFATTTAITGTNVKLVGTTPSAWTFTTHTGNFDGEAFDSDGGDACGSIRWDDSSCVLVEQAGYRFRNDDGGEGVPNSEWYDLSWSKRKRVTLTNADAVSYTNAAVKVTVTYDSDMQADFEDLRFTNSGGVTALNYFIESYTASTEAVVWVQIPTLATSSSATVYMYYGNGAVGDGGSATTTFTVADTFEDGGITEYSGETGEFSVVGTGAYERTYRLNASDSNNSKTTQIMRNTNVTVSQGQKIRFLSYIDTSTGSGDEICTHFGVQTSTTSYSVCLELFGVDRMSISRNALNRDTSGTVLSSTTVTYTTGWYVVEVDWRTNNSIFATLSQNGTIVATTTATSSTYTSGGIGYTLWGYHGGWDIYTSRPLLQTEPTATFGSEQVSGGASWLAALNTVATGVDVGETTRVRFIVENGGTPLINQNYEIEFAPKGAAPSCQSVSFGDYVEVPNVASCGTSAICMKSSTQFTNLDQTTDILGGSGSFISGQVVEDPSNNTGNISLSTSEYTEVEYAITPTSNASDSNYCFRVSNEGTDLDSYAQVAELGLIFAPNITSLSLNGGNDITLMGGATTTIYATGTISDQNGYTDLIGATTTIFRSGVGESCSIDRNNCYISGNSFCSFSNCSGDSCDVTCSADIYYFAEPTDIGTFAAETWRALLSVSDGSSLVATATAPSIDLITLRAISVDSSINYGSLAVSADTGSYNATTTVQNIGNDAIDVAIEGTDLTDGNASIIPVNEQKFATSTFTYSACTFCSALSVAPVNYELLLSKPTTTVAAITDEVFWGIAVPFGVAGTAHHGTNVFYAIGD